MKNCVIKQCNNDRDAEIINLATNSMISEYKNIIADETNIMKVRKRIQYVNIYF